jgi:S1-C subfamily serine protease
VVRVFDDDQIVTPPGAEDQTPPSKRRVANPGLAWLGIGIAIALGAIALVRAGDDTATLSPEQISSTISSEVAKGIADAQNAPPLGEIAFSAIQPSMVYISARPAGAAPDEAMSGAGVIIDADGQILTARHVVAGAESIEVSFVDGTRSSARVVSEQPENDIAVLVADQLPSVVVPAVLGGGVRTGDEVFATGHPFGLANSFSAGVVSGLNRTVPISGEQTLTGLIQFDAAVNPGNSGGPLLNRAGQVVGIVTALANPADENFFVGIGFAIPIGTAGGAAGAPQQ